TDSNRISELYAECLSPQTKMSLSKSPQDFRFNFLDGLKNSLENVKSFNWLLEDDEHKTALAYVHLTINNNAYFANIIISLPHAEYYNDILNMLIRFVGLKNSNATLYVTLSESIQSHGKFVEIIKEVDFEHCKMSDVLVKDYWQPIQERKTLASPITIFPDSASPACNSLNMVRK
ncbi:MAG: hypothetical protein AB7V50_09350, partial [Vampirovibrionia bacterium]